MGKIAEDLETEESLKEHMKECAHCKYWSALWKKNKE